jgi:hypothetical protein
MKRMMTAAVAAAVALAGCAQLAPAAEVQAYCQQPTGGDERRQRQCVAQLLYLQFLGSKSMRKARWRAAVA